MNKLSFVILWSMNSGLVLLVLDWLDSYSWWESHRFRKWRVLVKFSNLDRFMGKHRYRDRESSNVTSDFYRRRLGRFAVFVFFLRRSKNLSSSRCLPFFLLFDFKISCKRSKNGIITPHHNIKKCGWNVSLARINQRYLLKLFFLYLKILRSLDLPRFLLLSFFEKTRQHA